MIKINSNNSDGDVTKYQFGELDDYLLREGSHLEAYKKLGSHLTEQNGIKGTHFAVWAPNAQRVSVVGDFNGWDGNNDVMHPSGSGVWKLFVPNVGQGAVYKYEIVNRDGHLLPLKADPYAFYSELRPSTASRVWPLPHVKTRKQTVPQGRFDPITIYEVHLASWQRKDNDEWLTYNELGDRLIPYVKEMGFTHIELMPISEYPFDGSWGYQPIGLFAPTSRFGTPDDFARFVERAHEEGIGIIIDWVPGHFPSDAHGLAQFDGTHLYEHADPREGFHIDWNTLIFNYGRIEVANFLICNALFWLDRYGIDGLRVDAVASMLYRNYSRKEGEWVPNKYGGVENLEVVDFLKRLNEKIFALYPETTTLAEESTSWAGVSRPTYDGGLGFGFKWNMGWMHDTLDYMSKDPVYRKFDHHLMTFGLIYAWTENFVLPLSHDEVVHGKGSIFARMPGDEWQKFANLRAYYGFMYGHPGKKLLFMGCEFGQRDEWKYAHSLDWHLLDCAPHQGVKKLVQDLNHFYKNEPALYYHDCSPEGFEWLDSNNADASIYAFLRRGQNSNDMVIVICNFTPVVRYNYRIAVPLEGFYAEIVNTDAEIYGGSNIGNQGGLHAEHIMHHGRPYSLNLTVPPLATVILKYKG